MALRSLLRACATCSDEQLYEAALQSAVSVISIFQLLLIHTALLCKILQLLNCLLLQRHSIVLFNLFSERRVVLSTR